LLRELELPGEYLPAVLAGNNCDGARFRGGRFDERGGAVVIIPVPDSGSYIPRTHNELCSKWLHFN